MRRTQASALALLGCVLMTGCVNNRYLAPAATFRDSTTKTISTVSAFYNSRNSYELEIYLQNAATDPTVALAGTDATGHQTPLTKPVFSHDSIKARLNALALVGLYASRLCDLTNSTAASDFSTANDALGTEIGSLANSFQGLGATGDQTAASYVQPVTSLVDAVGQMFLNRERNRAVEDAITKGAPLVDIILNKIKDDMTNVFALQVATGAHQQLDTLLMAYNRDRGQLSYEQRVARLAEIQAVVESGTAAAAAAPAQLIAAMITANDALKAAAAKPKHASFADVNAALSTWSSAIQTLSSEIQPLVK